MTARQRAMFKTFLCVLVFIAFITVFIIDIATASMIFIGASAVLTVYVVYRGFLESEENKRK